MLELPIVRLDDDATEFESACPSGASPDYLVRPKMRALISELGVALDSARSEEQALDVVPGMLRKFVASEHLLTPEQLRGNGDSYTRHLIHTDPAGRFSLLSIVWMPGQASPVHGHNAWGVVGVHAGRVQNTCFEVIQTGHAEKSFSYVAGESHQAQVGCVVSTGAGDEGAHRLANPFDGPACTIHIYGMDLALEPTGINRYYD